MTTVGLNNSCTLLVHWRNQIVDDMYLLQMSWMAACNSYAFIGFCCLRRKCRLPASQECSIGFKSGLRVKWGCPVIEWCCVKFGVIDIILLKLELFVHGEAKHQVWDLLGCTDGNLILDFDLKKKIQALLSGSTRFHTHHNMISSDLFLSTTHFFRGNVRRFLCILGNQYVDDA